MKKLAITAVAAATLAAPASANAQWNVEFVGVRPANNPLLAEMDEKLIRPFWQSHGYSDPGRTDYYLAQNMTLRGLDPATGQIGERVLAGAFDPLSARVVIGDRAVSAAQHFEYKGTQASAVRHLAALAIHEVGHRMGLGHVDEPGNVMSPSVLTPPYQAVEWADWYEERASMQAQVERAQRKAALR